MELSLAPQEELEYQEFIPISIAGVVTIGDQSGAVIVYEVPASAESDMYFGEMGVLCSATVTISTPNAGSVTLITG